MEKSRNIFTALEKSAELPSDAESFSSISTLEEDQGCVNSEQVSPQPESSKETARSVSKSEASDRKHHHGSHDHSSTSRQSKHKVIHESEPGGSNQHCSLSEKHRSVSYDQPRHSSPSEHRSPASKTNNKAWTPSTSPKRHALSIDSGKHLDTNHKRTSLQERRRSSSSSKDGAHKTHSRSYKHIYDIPLILNHEIGYVTSPDISSEEETEESESAQTSSAAAASPQQRDEKSSAPVELSRHALKPTLDRYGGSLSERSKMLDKLQAIQYRIAANEAPARKRAARGEKKRMRSKREYMEGDFSGSCMEKIEYSLEEKPSLKRPEPPPEPEKKEKPPKKEKPKKVEKPKKKEKPNKAEKPKTPEKQKKREKYAGQDQNKHHSKKKELKKLKELMENQTEDGECSGVHGKLKHALSSRDKVRKKPRHRPLPPPVSFTELMQMAEQKQTKASHTPHQPNTKEHHHRSPHYKISRKHADGQHLKTLKENADGCDSDGVSYASPMSANFSSPSYSSASPSSAYKIHHPHPKSGSVSQRHPALGQDSASNSGSDCVSALEPDTADFQESGAHASSHKPRLHSGARKSGSSRKLASIRNVWETLFSNSGRKETKEASVAQKRSKADEADNKRDDLSDDDGEKKRGTAVGDRVRQVTECDRRKFREEKFDDRSVHPGASQTLREQDRRGGSSSRQGASGGQDDSNNKTAAKKMKTS